MSETTAVRDIDGVELEVGHAVQIDPDHDPRFAGCFLVVTELKPSWNGIQGYVRVPGESGGEAYYRVDASKVAFIGVTQWVHPRHDSESE